MRASPDRVSGQSSWLIQGIRAHPVARAPDPEPVPDHPLLPAQTRERTSRLDNRRRDAISEQRHSSQTAASWTSMAVSEWGFGGARAFDGRAGAIIVVDVLSFSTCVEVAV